MARDWLIACAFILFGLACFFAGRRDSARRTFSASKGAGDSEHPSPASQGGFPPEPASVSLSTPLHEPIGFAWRQLNTSKVPMRPLNREKFHVVIAGHERRAEEDAVVARCKEKGLSHTYYFHWSGPNEPDYWDDPEYLYPNKAQTSHASLRFIVDHYADLPEYIAFTHGQALASESEFWECFRAHDTREDELEMFVPLTTKWLDKAKATSLFGLLLNHPLFLPPIGVNVSRLPSSMKLWCCPNFVVSRKSIQRNSFEFWRNLYRVLLENEQQSSRPLPVQLPSNISIRSYVNASNLWEHNLQVFLTGNWDFEDPWRSPDEACEKYLYCEKPLCRRYAERQWSLPEPVSDAPWYQRLPGFLLVWFLLIACSVLLWRRWPQMQLRSEKL